MKRLIVFVFAVVLLGSCTREKVPELSTMPINYDLTTNAETGGIITSDGGSQITLKGVCWATSATPTVDDDTTINGTGIGNYISNITNLNLNTTYYVRAYATNSIGTGYGDELSFNTNISGCTDPTAFNYNPNATIDDGSCRFYPLIGDNYGGGIIFYLDGNGGGFIAAETDQSNGADWWCNNKNELTWQMGNWGIGAGFLNTYIIDSICTNTGNAADICINLNLNGYDDWFLPSREELNLLYQNLHLQGIGDFNSSYWSSSLYKDYASPDPNVPYLNPISQSFNNGSFNDWNSWNQLHYVRAIRAF